MFNLADHMIGFKNGWISDHISKTVYEVSSSAIIIIDSSAVLEITVGHWPFSDQFQHLADQNPFWLAKFPTHFEWDSSQ